MIDGRQVLGLIAARGGSKGVPGKNVRIVGGKPLIAWTIEVGRASRHLDRLVLSSDDDEIIAVAEQNGCEVPFKREASLAADDTPSIDVVLDALERCPGYGWVVLLQPTSPLRTAADIDGTLEKAMEVRAPACVSVCEAAESPYWMYRLDQSQLRPIMDGPIPVRRQELPKVYVLNGAVYAADTTWLAQHRTFVTSSTAAYEMPASRSLDIDTETDIKLLETMLHETAVP